MSGHYMPPPHLQMFKAPVHPYPMVNGWGCMMYPEFQHLPSDRLTVRTRVRFIDELPNGCLEEVFSFTVVDEKPSKESRRAQALGQGCDTVLAMMDSRDPTVRRSALRELKNLVVPCSLSARGREVVQRGLEVAKRGDDQDALVREIHGHVLKLALSAQGSEVLLSCLELLPQPKSNFIATELVGKVAEVAGQPHGREVLRRILELSHCADSYSLKKEILHVAPEICENLQGRDYDAAVSSDAGVVSEEQIGADLNYPIV